MDFGLGRGQLPEEKRKEKHIGNQQQKVPITDPGNKAQKIKQFLKCRKWRKEEKRKENKSHTRLHKTASHLDVPMSSYNNNKHLCGTVMLTSARAVVRGAEVTLSNAATNVVEGG